MNSTVPISPERMNFSQRLIDTLASSRALSASPTVLAREFNRHFVGRPVTVHAARKWLVGEAIPTQDKLRALANWLSVSVEWLRFGGNSQLGKYAEAGSASPQDNLVRLYLSLPHKERELARDFIAMLVDKSRRDKIESVTPEASTNLTASLRGRLIHP